MPDHVAVTEKEHLGRGLKSRHIQMIAIGGAIGTGLFYGSVYSIAFAGPAVILGYALVGLVIFVVMRSVGEMAVAEPVSGGWASYGARYIHPFVGFLIPWYALFGVAVGAAAEYNALGQYVQYWLPDFPIWGSALIASVIIAAINLIAVKIYGEAEFWLSMVKVVTIVSMIVLGLIVIFTGLGQDGTAVGITNIANAPGGFFAGGAKGFLQALVLICFAFGGVETVAMTAGEAVDVKRDMPKAVNSVFWRICIFYIGAVVVMLCLQPWNEIGSKGSPFVTVFSAIGIPAAAAIINFVVITAAMSAMNSGIYSSSRLVYNMAARGDAPRSLAQTSKTGMPYGAVLVVLTAQLLGVGINAVMPATAFEYFSSVVVILLILNWLTILVSHLRFRKQKIAAGHIDQLSFVSPFYPVGNYLAIAFFILILGVMFTLDFARPALIASPILIAVIWVGFKLTSGRVSLPALIGAGGTQLADAEA